MDITLIYFIYGLAFFSMGLALMQESTRTPLLAETRVLIPLTVFGFIHGSHEWLEMFLERSEWVTFRDPYPLGWIRIALLTVSFSSLFSFSLTLFLTHKFSLNRDSLSWILGFSVYIALIFIFGSWLTRRYQNSIVPLDVLVRYFLGVIGAMLAGLALFRRANQETLPKRIRLSTSFRWAGWGFISYALTQTIVPPFDLFPSNVWNTSIFLGVTGVPIQLLRATIAVWITISMLRAIHSVEKERERNFLEAQQARVDALDKIRTELTNRELMRQELLRHTVIAQEEERTRIARELHDETAQVLTAFSLNLATLQKSIEDNPKAKKQVTYLQSLCRQISNGIYNLVRNLRPAQLDELGLGAALQYLVDEARSRMALNIRLKVIGNRSRLDQLVETVFFRVAQEAITNIARHAGVKEADIELSYDDSKVILNVWDRGKGFLDTEGSAQTSGWGLAGMRERVASVGGQLILISEKPSGTRIQVVVPVKTNSNQIVEEYKQNGDWVYGKDPADASG